VTRREHTVEANRNNAFPPKVFKAALRRAIAAFHE
jgi:hypothetical protein